MIDGAEALFHRIANAMAEAIPEEWTDAELFAEFYPDGSKYEAEYRRATDGALQGFQAASDASRAVRELRRAFQMSGKPVWGRCWFSLKCDGKFDLRWGYDGCDADGNTILDEEAWRHHDEERRRRLTPR